MQRFVLSDVAVLYRKRFETLVNYVRDTVVSTNCLYCCKNKSFGFAVKSVEFQKQKTNLTKTDISVQKIFEEFKNFYINR